MAGMRKEALMGFGRRRIALLAAKTGAAIIAAFVFLAYFLLPFLWTHFEHEPALADISMRTETAQHIAGDPLNAGLVGSKDEVIAAFQQIGWLAADSLSLKNDLAIAAALFSAEPMTPPP
jgi:hypothetical protein